MTKTWNDRIKAGRNSRILRGTLILSPRLQGKEEIMAQNGLMDRFTRQTGKSQAGTPVPPVIYQQWCFWGKILNLKKRNPKQYSWRRSITREWWKYPFIPPFTKGRLGGIFQPELFNCFLSSLQFLFSRAKSLSYLSLERGEVHLLLWGIGFSPFRPF